MFKACDRDTFDDRRDTAILRLLLDTGLHRAELANIDTIIGTGKVNRVHKAAFGRKSSSDFDRYPHIRADHLDAETARSVRASAGPAMPKGLLSLASKRCAAIHRNRVGPMNV